MLLDGMTPTVDIVAPTVTGSSFYTTTSVQGKPFSLDFIDPVGMGHRLSLTEHKHG